MSRSVAYRNWLLVRSKEGMDPVVDSILRGEIPQEDVEAILVFYRDRWIKLYLESALLATEDFDAIAEALGIEARLVRLYHSIYYDVHSLRHIEKVSHLASIQDREEQQFKKWSIANGLEFIKWRIGAKTEFDSADMIQDLCADAFFRSREAFFNGNTADASREARQWSKHAAALVRQIEGQGGDEDDAALDLQLELDKISENHESIGSIEDLK